MVEFIVGFPPFKSGNNINNTLLSIVNEEIEKIDPLPFPIPTTLIPPKKKFNIWYTLQIRAFHWYTLIRSMLNLSKFFFHFLNNFSLDYQKRVTSKEVWNEYLLIAKNRKLNNCRRDFSLLGIIKNCNTSHVDQEIYDIIKDIFDQASVKNGIDISLSLYQSMCNRSELQNYDNIDIAISCAYLGIKYRYLFFKQITKNFKKIILCKIYL